MARPVKPQPARRRFLRDTVRAIAGLSAVVVVLGVQQRRSQADVLRLRPPGAVAEAAFSATCIRCGQCVQICPYQTLKLATLVSGPAAGTPYFVARDIPCEMCEDIPCVAACPSGALQSLGSIDEAKMGVAVLMDHENCLNYQGLRCDVCYRVCPLIDSAITLESERNARTGKHARFLPTVHSDICTGCGKCEKACVLEQAAIKVLPRALAKGELGHHYRFSWLESNDGKS
jgi:ferredoxin-type protein NapG